MDHSLPSFIKRNQQPIFIGILAFAALVYPCHSFFDQILRHSGNRQTVHYVGPKGSQCGVLILPIGSLRAGAPSRLDIDEFFDFCYRQLLLPASSKASITTGALANSYQVDFVPQREGSLEFSFQSANGSPTPYTYNYRADPAPIVALLLEVAVLSPATALLVAFVTLRIRAAESELRIGAPSSWVRSSSAASSARTLGNSFPV